MKFIKFHENLIQIGYNQLFYSVTVKIWKYNSLQRSTPTTPVGLDRLTHRLVTLTFPNLTFWSEISRNLGPYLTGLKNIEKTTSRPRGGVPPPGGGSQKPSQIGFSHSIPFTVAKGQGVFAKARICKKCHSATLIYIEVFLTDSRQTKAIGHLPSGYFGLGTKRLSLGGRFF